jgi:hypothetical protein
MSETATSAWQGADDTVLVAAATRSGQTWLCYMLAHALNARMVEPYCLLRGIVYSGHDYVRGLTQGDLPGRSTTRVAMVVKTHERPDPHYSLTRRLVLIVRDPRDTATSAALRYQVMTSSGTDVEDDARGMSLVSSPIEKPPTFKDRLWQWAHGNRLLAIALTARKWRSFHEAWVQLPFCHVVKFEDLLADPVRELTAICQHLEIEVSETQLRETAHLLSMAEIKRHHPPAEEGKLIGFRKGIAGDYKNHLSRLELAVVRYFCRRTAARFGYEL